MVQTNKPHHTQVATHNTNNSNTLSFLQLNNFTIPKLETTSTLHTVSP
jgi:hypothetical protein